MAGFCSNSDVQFGSALPEVLADADDIIMRGE